MFKTKKDAAGAVVKHKARLVAKGYVQREGIDFNEVFAPVACLDSVRLLVAVAAQQEWQLHHLDVKSAFLNGELQEEVYVAQSPSRPALLTPARSTRSIAFTRRCTAYGKHHGRGT